MKSAFFSIVLVVVVSLFLGEINFLVTDFLFCMLSATVIGVVFVISALSRGEKPDQAMLYLFYSIVVASIVFTIAWAVLATFGGLLGQAALAFDLVIGILGAATGSAFRLRQLPITV